MFFKLFIFFTIIPIVELYILIKVGAALGALNTVIIILVTASVGAYLAKTQGFQVIQKINNALHDGRMPGKELLDGLFVLIGGFLLLTPGFITDLVGLSMLLPMIRPIYIKIGTKLFQSKINTGEWKFNSH